MRTEREKMLAGELYDPLDVELVAARRRARDLCQELNVTRDVPDDVFAAGNPCRVIRELMQR
jgi:maltose O-acetyltransferase